MINRWIWFLFYLNPIECRVAQKVWPSGRNLFNCLSEFHRSGQSLINSVWHHGNNVHVVHKTFQNNLWKCVKWFTKWYCEVLNSLENKLTCNDSEPYLYDSEPMIWTFYSAKKRHDCCMVTWHCATRNVQEWSGRKWYCEVIQKTKNKTRNALKWGFLCFEVRILAFWCRDLAKSVQIVQLLVGFR